MTDALHPENPQAPSPRFEEDHDILEALFRTMSEPVFYRDRELRFKRCNESFCAFLGCSMERILGHTRAELDPGAFPEALEHADTSVDTASGGSYTGTFSIGSDGVARTYRLSSTGVRDSNGRFQGMIGLLHDISAQEDSQRRAARLMRLKDAILAINSEILEACDIDRLFVMILERVLEAIDHADVGCVFLLDEEGMLRIAAVSGYSQEDSRDFKIKVEDTFQWKKSKSEVSETLIINDLQDFMNANDMPDTILKDMEGNTIRSTMSAPLVIDGSFYGLINLDSSRNNVFDDTDRSLMECVRSQVPIAISMFKSYERTSYESEHDKLTGLFNRRYFEAIFSMIKNKALRFADRFSLVLFDINYLKKVNDSLGHLAGDALLLHFATEMKAWFRSSDIFARFGGDEFIALMFHADGERGMERLEEQRRRLSEQPVLFKGERLICSFGYGIAVFNEDGTEYDDLVAVADKRMYADKMEFKERSLRGRETHP